VSGAKIGIAAASGGVSTVVGARDVGLPSRLAEAVNVGKVAMAAAKVAAVLLTQSGTSAATKAATTS